MSKIGNLPIVLPKGVSVEIDGSSVRVKGPTASLERIIPSGLSVSVSDSTVLVTAKNENERLRALHGTNRAILANMVKGVSLGWSKGLELVGTGYRAETTGRTLTLSVGFSHPIKIEAPEGITFKVEKTDITVAGIDKELVGQIAAKIRSIRPPEPYKGKGIKYKGEVIRRKAGKAAKAQTA